MTMSINAIVCFLLVCIWTRTCYGAPNKKRQSSPYNVPIGVSSSRNHISPPGDMTSFLDQVHQTFSGSNSGSGYVQHQFHSGPSFPSQNGVFSTQNGAANVGTGQLPGKCNNIITQTCPADCTEIDSITGCVSCKTNCQTSGSSSLSNTNGKLSINTVTGTTAPQTQVTCAPFPSNCPRGGATIQNGCPICSALQSTTTTTRTPGTCAPVRCVAPCNKGIYLDNTGCPVCLCN